MGHTYLIPLLVRFTGLEFDPMDLLQSRQVNHLPIPPEWSRVRFDVKHSDETWEKVQQKIERWIQNNTDGRWTMYHILDLEKRTVVVAFELDVDVVMFRLKSGEIAWREENNSEF